MSNEQQQTTESPRKSGGLFYGWYIVGASVAMNIYLSVAFFQGFQAFFLPIVNEFGWSRTLMSGAFSLRQLESGILAPVVGVVVDKWGPRQVILWGVIVGGLGLISVSFITEPWMFYGAFLITAIGVSGCSHGISWTVAVANWFHRLRGRALGMAYLGPVIGGPLVVTMVLLEEAVGWRQATVMLGSGLWIVGIPISLIARSRPEEYGLRPDGDPPPSTIIADSPTADISVPVQGDVSARSALRMPSFWLLSLLFALLGLGVSGVMVHQVPLFQSIGFSARESAEIVGLTFFLSGIGRLGAGALIDRFPARMVVVAMVLMQTASYVVLFFTTGTGLLQVVLFCLFYGVAFGASIPTRPLIIRDLFGSQAFGAINGLAQGISIALGMVGPLLMGLAYDLTGTYQPAIALFVVTTAAVLPMVFLLRPAHPSSEPSAPR